MEENKPQFKSYAEEDGESIFDKHKHKNQANRERQFRVIRMVLISIATVVLGFVVYRVVVVGARVAAGLVDDLEQATATATLDLSSLDVASPTPPPTATILYGGETFEREFEDYDPDDPNATPRAGAIFFDTPTPILPTATSTPLPTAEIGNFGTDDDTPVLPGSTETPDPAAEIGNFNNGGDAPIFGWQKDPRCSDRETESEYVYCMVDLAEAPLEP